MLSGGKPPAPQSQVEIMETRNREIKIRLTDEEHRQLMERKTKPRLAEWVRDTALSKEPKKQPRPIDPKLLFELNRIGVNLNQIARYCNNQSATPDLIGIGLALRGIENQLSEIKGELL